MCHSLAGERWYAVPKGDLRFEETSDYQTSEDRLSDRSVAGWPFLAIAAGCVVQGDFSILLRSTRNDGGAGSHFCHLMSDGQCGECLSGQ